MKDKLKIESINELDIEIFDEYFYKQTLKNVVNLIKKKNEKNKNECETCACLEQVKQDLQP